MAFGRLISASEIAAKVGRTRNAVIGRIHRINRTYSGRAFPSDVAKREQSEQRKKVKKAREEGEVTAMLANIARKMQRNEAIRLAFQNGATQEAIGLVLGVTRQAISLIVKG